MVLSGGKGEGGAMKKLWWSVLYLAAISLLSNVAAAFIKRDFRTDAFPFRPWPFEREGRFYERLKIRKWKDRVPDMSKYLRSLPRKALGGATGGQVRMLVQETCVAELVHGALMVLALPVLLCREPWAAALVLVYVLGNLPFIMIQRYNRPRLLRLAEKLERREEATVHE